MRFLKILFWIVVAVLVMLFAVQNWRDVSIELWGNLQADVKIPVMLIVAFLLGFLPTWLACKAKLWRLNNRLQMGQPEPGSRAAATPGEIE